MSDQQTGRYDHIARRWLALVELRQDHFIDLCDSGRWRHYYTEDELIEEVRKVLQVCRQWAAILGAPPDDRLALHEARLSAQRAAAILASIPASAQALAALDSAH
jgi:uncharacterized repeat protein (TIGR03809 family)